MALIYLHKRPRGSLPQRLALQHERMRAKAAETGYFLEIVYRSDFASPQQLSKALWARGCTGIILSPALEQKDSHLNDLTGFDWSRFAVVKVVRAHGTAPCHCIRSSAFSDMKATLDKVLSAGYRRPGILMLADTASSEDDFSRLGAVKAFEILRKQDFAALRLWYRHEITPADLQEILPDIDRFRPDCIIGFPISWRVRLEESGYRMPRDFAFVGLPVVPAEAAQSGVATSGFLFDLCGQIFPLALEVLHQEISSGRCGLPKHPSEWIVPQVWQEGVTMPGLPKTPRA